MGGIKNKLNKLSNKTIPLSDSCLTSPFSQRGTIEDKQSLPLGKGRQMSIAHRWGRYTKYLSIACLSLAILSTLILNIVSSYSSSKIESNAIDGNTSTLANDSSSISLSFSNATGSCTDTSNPANVCMEIPDGGGIATGGHTVTVNAADDIDYKLTISSKTEQTGLMNTDNENAEPIRTIAAPCYEGQLTTDLESCYDMQSGNAWGYSARIGGAKLSYTSLAPSDSDPEPGPDPEPDPGADVAIVSPFPALSTPDTLLNSKTDNSHSVNVEYSVDVKDVLRTTPGRYSIDVVYTATAVIPPATLSNLVLNDTLLTGQQKEFAVQGTNLSTATRVRLCNADDQYLCYTTDEVTTYPGTDEAETLISFMSPNVAIAGVYDVIVQTASGEARLDDSFRVIEQSICRNGDRNSDCQVDIDDNMVPIRYVGDNSDGSAIWTTVDNNEVNFSAGYWYDYGKKQWANAVTVASGSLSKYKNKSNVVIDENDVLGYWVYIPRYAYEVQRRDATDHYVVDEYPLPDNTTTGVNTSMNSHALKNDFIIQFEKSDTLKKTPAASCNAWRKSAQDMWVGGVKPTDNSDQAGKVLAVDYRTGCDISREYGSSVNTTWGTHPAFSFGNTQLNGVWVGKFETTGYTSDEPTVKPNLHAFLGGNEDGYRVAGLYDVAKSIGVYDSLNSGGGGRIPISQNYHRLASATSHMTKSSEWGAALYLAMSYYGAGVNEIQSNTAEGNRYELDPLDEYISNGVTGCGPSNNGDFTSYSTDESHAGDSVFCGSAERSYSGSIGVLSSTTNNAYGIYGMSGGADDFVAGSLTSSNNAIVDPKGQFSVLVQEPYTDLYKEKDGFGAAIPGWSIGGSFQTANADVCTWETCGGKAIHEVSRLQSAMIVNYIPPTNGWGNAMLYFRELGYWFTRGGSYSDAEDDSKWYDTSNILLSMTSRTDIYYANGFRVSLLVRP